MRKWILKWLFKDWQTALFQIDNKIKKLDIQIDEYSQVKDIEILTKEKVTEICKNELRVEICKVLNDLFENRWERLPYFSDLYSDRSNILFEFIGQTARFEATNTTAKCFKELMETKFDREEFIDSVVERIKKKQVK